MIGDQSADEILIRDIALREHCFLRNRPFEAGAEIVDDHYRPPAVEQREHRMASDIAGSAGNQDGRFGTIRIHPAWSFGFSLQQKPGMIVSLAI
jgi:hypothetical protein